MKSDLNNSDRETDRETERQRDRQTDIWRYRAPPRSEPKITITKLVLSKFCVK